MIRRGGEENTMQVRMLKSKIHRARVTECNLEYEGSITLDAEVMKMAGILAYELVHVVDVPNGARFQTYAIEGGRGCYCLNGAAARLAQPGDTIIVMAYVAMDERAAREHEPRIVRLDEQNRVLADGDRTDGLGS